MMSRLQDDLYGLLVKDGSCGECHARNLLHVMDDLFSLAESGGEWPLAHIWEDDRERLRDIYADAFRRRLLKDGSTYTQVEELHLLSLRHHLEHPETEDGRVSHVLWGSSISAQVYMAYGSELDGLVYEVIDGTLARTLFRGLGQVRLGPEPIHRDWPLVWDAVKVMLFYYVGLAYGCQIDAMYRLAPAVKSLHQALPVGFLKGNPHTLVMLVA